MEGVASCYHDWQRSPQILIVNKHEGAQANRHAETGKAQKVRPGVSDRQREGHMHTCGERKKERKEERKKEREIDSERAREHKERERERKRERER